MSFPNATEDAKVASDFTALQTVVNGQLDTSNLSGSAAIVDTQLASPNNATRRLLLTVACTQNSLTWPVLGQTFYPAGVGFPLQVAGAAGTVHPPIWAGDAGYSGNPKDFLVAGKTSQCLIRMTLIVNSTAPGFNIAGGLCAITAIPSAGAQLAFTLSAGLTGSGTSVITAPTAGTLTTVESAPFAMPVDTRGYVLAVNISGGTGTQAANSMFMVSLQLYGLNS